MKFFGRGGGGIVPLASPNGAPAHYYLHPLSMHHCLCESPYQQLRYFLFFFLNYFYVCQMVLLFKYMWCPLQSLKKLCQKIVMKFVREYKTNLASEEFDLCTLLNQFYNLKIPSPNFFSSYGHVGGSGNYFLPILHSLSLHHCLCESPYQQLRVFFFPFNYFYVCQTVLLFKYMWHPLQILKRLCQKIVMKFNRECKTNLESTEFDLCILLNQFLRTATWTQMEAAGQ